MFPEKGKLGNIVRNILILQQCFLVCRGLKRKEGGRNTRKTESLSYSKTILLTFLDFYIVLVTNRLWKDISYLYIDYL